MSPSERRTILVMFEEDYQYFPTLREIRDELIEGQMVKIREKSQEWTVDTPFSGLERIYRERWEMLFDIAKLGNIDKPLTPDILSNPTNPITTYILYLYSMETFIYSDLNRACREKDTSKIRYFGAFAAALSYIIYYANSNRSNHKLQGTNTLYRGL